MICVFETMNTLSNKTWNSRLKLFCPRKYIKEINTENQENYRDNKAKNKRSSCAELECRSESADRAAKNEKRHEPTDME